VGLNSSWTLCYYQEFLQSSTCTLYNADQATRHTRRSIMSEYSSTGSSTEYNCSRVMVYSKLASGTPNLYSSTICTYDGRLSAALIKNHVCTMKTTPICRCYVTSNNSRHNNLAFAFLFLLLMPFAANLLLAPSIRSSSAFVLSYTSVVSQQRLPQRAFLLGRPFTTTARTASPFAASTALQMSSTDQTRPSEVLSDIALNLQDVRKRVEVAAEAASQPSVQLVAVSKTKPVEQLMEAYNQGQRLFGENYVQELIDKVSQMPPDVHWHFIGTLQSNKVNGLIKSVFPNKAASLTVQTVATLKLATKLNAAMQEYEHRTLPIFVQVNTSGELSKGGVEPDQVVTLCQQIVSSCDKLQLHGLMTIGAEGDASCFDRLVQCRDEVLAAASTMSPPTSDLLSTGMQALSMGMSGDFEVAIAKGATHVRIGSTIFGPRDYSRKVD
jgi:PLP dependent protein